MHGISQVIPTAMIGKYYIKPKLQQNKILVYTRVYVGYRGLMPMCYSHVLAILL